jgi:hypothetical protein
MFFAIRGGQQLVGYDDGCLLSQLLLRWGWNYVSVANGPIVHPPVDKYPPDDIWVNMEQRWNDIARRKLKICEGNSQKHFAHHRTAWSTLGVNRGLYSQKPAADYLICGTVIKLWVNRVMFQSAVDSTECCIRWSVKTLSGESDQFNCWQNWSVEEFLHCTHSQVANGLLAFR